MKCLFFISIALFISTYQSLATTTYTIGATGTYSTISAAYAVCTGATDYILEIKSDYNQAGETWPLSLSQLANKNATNTVTIRPVSGATISISQSVVGDLIHLNGADYVIFDGRAGGTGSSAFTLTNTSTNLLANVFSFDSDATYNTLKYLTIKGSGTNTGAPVSFGSGSSTGNSNNTISYNDITKSASGTPAYGVYSYGSSAGNNNSSNVISNNNFYDLGQGTWCGAVAYSNGWTISNNNFYQTASISLTSSDLSMIYIGSNVVGVTITGNYFGGRNISCGGAAFAITTGSYTFYGIDFNSVTGSVSILNNTFANIAATSAGANSVRCIDTYGSATYTIGSTGNGNLFGSTSTAGSITITGSTASTAFYGIYHSGTNASNSIAYNTMAGITQTHTTAATSPEFNGIYAGGNSSGTITYNTFGSSSGPIQLTGTGVGIAYQVIAWNSNNNATITNNTFQNFTISNGGSTNDNDIIYTFGSGTNTISNNTIGSSTANNMSFSLTDQVNAIHCYSSGTPTISNNTIQQFNQTGTGSSAGFYGIYIDFMNGIASISTNTIKNITTAGTGSYAFNGIYLYSTNASATNSIISNEIKTITASSTGAGSVYGIYAYDGGGTIQKNRVSGITFNSSNASANLFGIVVDAADNLNFYNNVVLIDNGGGSAVLRGILNRSGSANTFTFYHNTVKIYGTATAGSNNSNAFADLSSTGGTVNIKNNIFQNTRTNSGGTGAHLAIRLVNTTPTINSDFNYLEASGTGGYVGAYNGTNYSTISSYRTASSKDANSKNATIVINVLGNVPGGTSSDVQGTGTNLSAIVADDKDGTARSTTPWMGAFESPVALPIDLLSFTATPNRNKIDLKWTTATEMNNDYFTIEKTLDGKIFEIVAIVNGSGNTPNHSYYTCEDTNPYTGISYYRLSQTDYDGKSESFDLVSVNFKQNNHLEDLFSVYPNPNTQNGLINVVIDNSISECTIEISDLLGKKYHSAVLTSQNGNNHFQIEPTENYAAGTYVITIISDKISESKILIIK